MDLFTTPEWVQAGELGLAFIVVLLCSGLVMYVMKSSARREHELLEVIMKVLPLMESMSASMTSINIRLEHIEESVGVKPLAPRKRGETVPRRRKENVKVD
jgi:hypothetical protein